jgi:hypothetical protein
MIIAIVGRVIRHHHDDLQSAGPRTGAGCALGYRDLKDLGAGLLCRSGRTGRQPIGDDGLSLRPFGILHDSRCAIGPCLGFGIGKRREGLGRARALHQGDAEPTRVSNGGRDRDRNHLTCFKDRDRVGRRTGGITQGGIGRCRTWSVLLRAAEGILRHPTCGGVDLEVCMRPRWRKDTNSAETQERHDYGDAPFAPAAMNGHQSSKPTRHGPIGRPSWLKVSRSAHLLEQLAIAVFVYLSRTCLAIRFPKRYGQRHGVFPRTSRVPAPRARARA